MTGLPAEKSAWPPLDHAARYRRMAVSDAWYAGSEKLRQVYGGTGSQQVTTGGPPTTINPSGSKVIRAVRAAAAVMWGDAPADGEPDARRHLPTAQDIAIISSELLHADPPTITVDGPRYPEDDPNPKENPDGSKVYAYRAGDPMPETVKAQERLDVLLDGSQFPALLLAAAETQSPLGSVALRVAFDKAVVPHPVITRNDADGTLPDYAWGLLQAVTFWRVVEDDQSNVWRHFEVHGVKDDQGRTRIQHALYKGTSDSVGERVSLFENPKTRGLYTVVDKDGFLPIVIPPVDGAVPRTAVSIPNRLPDPMDRRGAVGASDYTDAVIDLLDAGDKLWTDMMMAADDAKSRLIIGASMLESKGAGKGVEFNMNQRVFQKLNLPPAEKEGGSLPIEKVQFEMRLAEYWAGIVAIHDRTIEAAGYNVGTMGGAARDTTQKTATEVRSDNARSMATRDKKIRYWAPALESLLTGLLVVDAAEFGSGITPFPVRVQYPEAVQPGMAELLADASVMKREGLATLTYIIGYLHPDWDEGQVAEQVAEIEEAAKVIDPITLDLGGFNPQDGPNPTGPTPRDQGV